MIDTKRHVRIPLLCLLALTLSACSALDWAYNNAPSFVADEMVDAFDLDDEQSALLETRLDQFFAWHRQQELTRYQAVLERAANNASDGIVASEFLWLMDELRDARMRSMARALDDFGDLAARLSDSQIDRFAETLHDRADESRDYLAKSAQQREIFRVERNLDRLQDWFGDFDYQTERRARERLADLPDLYEAWYTYRDARQAEIIAALRGGGDGPALKARLKRALLNPDTDYARAFEPARQAYWQEFAVVLEDISGWLSPRQHRAAAERLQRYERILVSLRTPD
ncbi:MAG: DUF6279 family lipoprotein [Gammaproteobacteria bacterium]|nr:DUF6279 family lipoprotein [Gammaproteobacteria bacterium]